MTAWEPIEKVRELTNIQVAFFAKQRVGEYYSTFFDAKGKWKVEPTTENKMAALALIEKNAIADMQACQRFMQMFMQIAAAQRRR